MTALCGGGTSGQKFGTAAVVDYASGLLATLAAEFGGPWLIPLIPLAGLPPLVLATFCTTDPPAMPTFTQAEADALLNLTLGADFASGLPKLKDALLNIVWNDACQCTSGVYTPATPPAQPAGSITVVQVGPGLVGPCASQPILQGALNAGIQTDGPGFLLNGKNATWVASTQVCTGVLGANTFIFQLTAVTPGGNVVLGTLTFNAAGNGIPQTLSIALPLGTTKTLSQWTLNAGNSPALVNTGKTDFYCNGSMPGDLQQPCCPPDQATAATLNAILSLVTSMQRNYAPFGYILGTAHAALTGVGSIPVSRLLGVKVALTTVPGSLVQLPGNPQYIKDAGWMSVSEVDGMIQELRIARAAFTWFPRDMAIADHVNYDLFPGVVATITEMEPEP